MAKTRFRVVKPEIRVLGVDDGVFTPHTKGSAVVIGAVFRGGYWLDGVMHTRVRIDGLDATQKIARMVTHSPHHKQLRIIMLDGVTMAGFNVIDIIKLNIMTGLPVIAVTRDKPNFKEIRAALRNLSQSEARWKAIYETGKLMEVRTGNRNGKVYIQTAGILDEDAKKIVQITSTRSSIPESLRVAHLIARGITIQSR